MQQLASSRLDEMVLVEGKNVTMNDLHPVSISFDNYFSYLITTEPLNTFQGTFYMSDEKLGDFMRKEGSHYFRTTLQVCITEMFSSI